MKQRKFETVPLKEILNKVVTVETNGIVTKATKKEEPYSVRCEPDESPQPATRFRKQTGAC